MDDYNFQQQLHVLKERVSELSSNRSPALEKYDDPFMNQLHDLKAHLASMQERFMKFQDSMPQMRLTAGPEPARMPSLTSLQAPSRPGQYALPSYWISQFESLNNHVQSLEGRMASLESTISDLEDKVDAMDPNRFTPPESTSDFEYPFMQNNSNEASNVQAKIVPELSSESAYPPSQPPYSDHWRLLPSATYSPSFPEARRADRESLQLYGDMDDVRSNIASVGSARNDMRRHAALPSGFVGNDQTSGVSVSGSIPPVLPKPWADLDRSFSGSSGISGAESSSRGDKWLRQVHEQSHGLHAPPQYTSPGVSVNDAEKTRVGFSDPRNRSPEEIVDAMVKKRLLMQHNGLLDVGPDGPVTEEQARRDAKCVIRKIVFPGDNPSGQLQTKPNGGVAFRDREIVRLDEQLRIAQEQLRASEETLSQKEAKISEMERARDDAHVAAQNREKRLSDLQDKSDAQKAEIRDLHKRIEHNDKESRHWQDCYQKVYDGYQRTTDKLQACENSLREQQERKTSAINRLIHDHEGEIKRLQTFCSQKEALVHRQEQIISEGGSLLDQRDDEIERLQRLLRASEDDKEDAVRNASRIARLLDEKNAVLEEKNAELLRLQEWLQMGHPRQRNNSTAFDEEARPSSSNGVDAGDTERAAPGYSMDNAQSHEPPVYETPSAEQRSERSSTAQCLWDTAIPEYRHPDFPNATPNGYIGVGKRRGRGSRRHKVHRDEMRNFWGAPSPSREGDSGACDHAGSVERGAASCGSQLEDATLRPPLPAPPSATARRMASEANLRMASRNNHESPGHKRLSKHQSLLELRGNRMQAYVETELESSGEFGGEV